MKKLAIIGASTGQLPLCLKAKELGLYTICFAWEEGAVCKDLVDKFYPISIMEKEAILDICKTESIDGVTSNGSDLTAEIVSYIATELHLHGINYSNFLKIKNKYLVRELTKEIEGLAHVNVKTFSEMAEIKYPCIIKPQTGASKKGVFYVEKEEELKFAIDEIKKITNADIIIEEYVPGIEISVETISFEGNHYVIQFTDKENSGPPHFVELSHHQPSQISIESKHKIEIIVPRLLESVGIENGASHIELKIDNDNIYLIEINPRGGGDEISNKLVELSTGFDYIAAIIDVSIGKFKQPSISNKKYSGIYFLCQQSANRLKYFEDSYSEPWLIEKKYNLSKGLTVSSGNYDRNGYLIYQDNSKIILD